MIGSDVTIHIPCNSIQFRLLPFDFINYYYFDSSMQNINVFLFLQHNIQREKFLLSSSVTLLTIHQCCVDVVSVRSCLKLDMHDTLRLLSKFCR